MPYPGGKAGAGVAERIINLMPPHRVYIEPFLGDAAVMRRKRWAAVNIGIDADPESPGLEWLAGAAVNGESGDGRSRIAKVGDARAFLSTYAFSGDELVYCDPPYLMSTRTGRRLYKHELSSIEHRHLLRVIRDLPCRVMISGYASELYDKLLQRWNVVHYQTMTRGGRTAREYLWFNFPRPLALHDYSCLGEGFRERERIRRKQRRWMARLANMPLLERQALLSALAAIAGPGERIYSPGMAVPPG